MLHETVPEDGEPDVTVDETGVEDIKDVKEVSVAVESTAGNVVVADEEVVVES
jgi:SepF-like predicted cell division protein (DUF552 family)